MTADLATLRRLFAGAAESAFCEDLGYADWPVIDYVADLMARFLREEETTRWAVPGLDPVASLAAKAALMPEGGTLRREMFRRAGDVGLFRAGMFPEALSRRPGRDLFVGTCACGKRSYMMAACCGEADPEAEVLKRVAERFELCAWGLNKARARWAA